ncbi:MAG: hypothetical protein Ct9H300mP17_11180 [Candidatus Nitrosopelagicus sp.]|nr:MAG: hypothetical protein Ct9H300mP17_11180 [Candidatus Nitrosopelagicus sp.]
MCKMGSKIENKKSPICEEKNSKMYDFYERVFTDSCLILY